jgi:hypothetical protein
MMTDKYILKKATFVRKESPTPKLNKYRIIVPSILTLLGSLGA